MKDKDKKKAVALKYDVFSVDKSAPKVLAKGFNHTAEEIIRIAKENDIAIHEDPDLVTVLMKTEIGDEIPEELYESVAEILGFVYRMNKKYKDVFGL